MSRRTSRTYLVPHLLKNFLQKRTTVSFPYGPLDLGESYRGQVVVDIDACVGCGRCARDCPTGSLVVEHLDGGGIRILHFYDRCASCGQCEISCTPKAIRLDPSFRAAAASREELRGEWIRD
ncbi:MAG TPA: 4Fe-4S binding protein [Anaerolineae bacterium]|nr:4Fe-4S binding protein [Anaerolineae bacterium]